MDAKNRSNDETVADAGEREVTYCQGDISNIHHHLVDSYGATGQSHQWGYLAEKVVNVVWITEGHPQDETCVYPGIGHCNSHDDAVVHNSTVVKRETDGHIAVIGHGGEENHLCPQGSREEEELGQAASI